MAGILVLAIIILAVIIFFFSTIEIKGKRIPFGSIAFLTAYFLSLFVFAFGLMTHAEDYHVAIDPIDSCYIPFGGKHIISLLFYFIIFNISAFLIWKKGRNFPPLTLVLSLIFLIIGAIISFAVLIQIGSHNTESLGSYKGNDASFYFFWTPLFSLFIAIYLWIKILNEEKNISQNRTYKNKFLNDCNRFLSQKYDVTIWAWIFLLPVFIVLTLILMLFGQDYNSLIKVFTDTTTWTFSQKTHPPILDHTGHYLCTVAAKGNPNLVKPLYIGKRHSRPIIVNRQLQIANAFEEMIQDFSPKIHRFVRRNYDNYGYNLSKKINSELGSNLTYILMKPLELIFLISLYLLETKPEQKISKQYR